MQRIDENPYQIIQDERFNVRRIVSLFPTDLSRGTHHVTVGGARGFSGIAEPLSMIPATGLTGDLSLVICGRVPMDSFDDGAIRYNGYTLEIRGERPLAGRSAPDDPTLYPPSGGDMGIVHDINGDNDDPTGRTLVIRDLRLENLALFAMASSNENLPEKCVVRDCIIACVSATRVVTVIRELDNPAYVEIFNNMIFVGILSGDVIWAGSTIAGTIAIENNAIFVQELASPGQKYGIVQEYGSGEFPCAQTIRNNAVVMPGGAGSICYALYGGSTAESNASTDETGSSGLRAIVPADEFESIIPGETLFMRTKFGGALAWGGSAPTAALLSVDGVIRARDGLFTVGINEIHGIRHRDALRKLLPDEVMRRGG